MHKKNSVVTRLVAAFTLLFVSALASAAQPLAISPLGYQITQVDAVAGTSRTYDVTSRVGIVNAGDPVSAVTARLTSSSSSFIVLDGDVAFGNVPHTSQLRPAISRDTFKLRITLPQKVNLVTLLNLVRNLHQSLGWQISCGSCGVNRPPLANAGIDQTAFVLQTVTLDGSASSDPDGQSLTYAWSFVSRPAGSAATLSSSTAVKPTFVPDREGDYLLRLIVNDGQVGSAPDTVQISTRNSAPVANAGADQTALAGQAITLNGSGSSDVDGDALTYAWSIASRPAGSAAQIVKPDEVNATFTPDVSGEYLIELIVDDGTVSSSPDTMSLSTTQMNVKPTAEAGLDQAVHVGQTATLDGSLSSDPEGNALTFHWTLNAKPLNSTTSLDDPGSARPGVLIDKPGTYVAQLMVNDGRADSDPDTVTLSTSNTAPVASIQAPASVESNATVQFNGSASSDVDGDALGYKWSILSTPAGSTAVLSDVNAVAPTFVADRAGTYVVQLIVNDGQVDSAPTVASTEARDIAPIDSDGDGLTDDVERLLGTLPNNADTDGDGFSDGVEATSGANPLSNTSTPGFRLEVRAGNVGASLDSRVSVDVHVTRDVGSTASVQLHANGLPAGVTARDAQMPAGVSDGVVSFRISPTASIGTSTIQITATIAGVTRTAPVTLSIAAAQLRAQALIRAAEAAGTLDRVTALQYRGFAVIGDPRLPSQYRGSGSQSEDSSLLPEIKATLIGASAETHARLEPFTLRPINPASAYSQMITATRGLTQAAAPSTATFRSATRLGSQRLASTAAAGAAAVSAIRLDYFPNTCAELPGLQEPADTWVSGRSTTVPIRVWAQCVSGNSDAAEGFIGLALPIFEKIYAPMSASMGKTPKPDLEAGAVVSRHNDNGDAAIDIYILYPQGQIPRDQDGDRAVFDTNALAATYGDGGGFQTSAFVVYPASTLIAEGTAHVTAIHEFFHVLQFAHAAQVVGTSWWYTEASAHWAEAHFDRVLAPWRLGATPVARAAYDEVYEPWFVDSFQRRSSTTRLNDADGDVEREAFIWPYYMQQATGSADTPAKAVWTAVESEISPHGADAKLNGVFSFESKFREFAQRDLNTVINPGNALPTSRRFVALDPATTGGFVGADNEEPVTQHIQLASPGDLNAIAVGVTGLAAQYAHIRVMDTTIRRVEVDLSDLHAVAAGLGIDIDGYEKVQDKDWVHRDLNDENKLVYCFDNPEEKLEELRLVISNHTLDGAPVTVGVPIKASATPCPMKWVGTATYDWQIKIFPNTHTHASANVTWVSADVTPNPFFASFKATGSVNIDVFEANGCVAEVSPRSDFIGDGDGNLLVDYTRKPAVVEGDGASGFLATITDCQGHQDFVPMSVIYMEGPQVLNAAEDLLKSHRVVADDVVNLITLDYEYRREFDKGP